MFLRDVIKIKIELNLGDHGWLDINIFDKEKELSIPVAYLSDSIRELILSLCVFLEGTQDVVMKLQTEPGEYRFRLKSHGKVCLFEVYEFDNNFCRDELEKGQCVISTQIEADKLINKFYREILKLKEIGIDEFKKRWGYDFPQDAFMRLTQARKDKKTSRNV